jgi:hypothetical protein
MQQIVSPIKVFENLLVSNNNNYVLPDDTMERIVTLFDQIGFSSNTPNTYVNQYNAAPTTHKSVAQEHDGRAIFLKQQARKQQQQQQKKSWNAKPAFSVTKFALLDEGDNIIDDLRIELNKINDKTLDTRMPKILELLNNLLETCSDNSDDSNPVPAKLNDAFTMFFQTVVLNKNPALYAKFFELVYAQLTDQVSAFMQKVFQTYVDEFHTINDVSETNYNDFCDFTADNLRRKNISAFFAHVVMNGFLPEWNRDFIVNHINNLFTQVIEKVEFKAKQKEVEEITENIVVLITSLGTFIDKATFMPFIEQINAIKPGEKPGLTSRTKFKYMDLQA